MKAFKEDYLSSIIFKSGLGYQEVYSSQNYGTFYSVYISFDCKPGENENEIILYNVKFEIINYKGVVNLGIKDVKFEINQKKQPQFKVMVEALHGKRVFEYGEETIDLGKVEPILAIERLLLKMSNFDENQSPNDNSVQAFDNEYYYRDGISKPEPRTARAGMEGYSGTISWKRCYKTYNRIIL